MKRAFNIFKQSIDEIKNHLEFDENYKTLLKNVNTQGNTVVDEASAFLKANYSKEKIFDYRANIISLYGAFEQFIEEVIRDYITELSTLVSTFQELNSSITSSYLGRWKDLSGKLTWAKFSHISEQGLVTNLFDTIVNNRPNICPDCFLQNGGNYRHDVIKEMMKSLGFNNYDSQLPLFDPLRTLLDSKGLLNSEMKFMTLDDLVDRRNEIAHGTITLNILSNESCLDIVYYIECYAEAVSLFLNDELNEIKWNQLSGSICQPDSYVRGGYVVSFTASYAHLSVGKSIVLKCPIGHYPKYLETNIESIHADTPKGATVSKSDLNLDGEETVFSLGLSSSINTHYSFKFD